MSQDSASDAIKAGFASGDLTARVAFGAIVGVAGGALGVLGALLGFGKKRPASTTDRPVDDHDVDLPALRAERLARLQAAMRAHGVDVCLLFNEPNIRYATGASTMPMYA